MTKAQITESTLIPLSLAITMAGGIFWLTTIYSKTEAIASAMDKYTTALISIDQRLSRIEGRLQQEDSSDERDH